MIKNLLLPALFSCFAASVGADTIKLDMGEKAEKEFSARDAAAISSLVRQSSLQRDWDAIEGVLASQFARFDPEGDGYKMIDQNKRALVAQANLRSRTIQKWLVYDLDGDGSVSDAEVREFAAQPVQVRSGALTGRMEIVPTEEQKEKILAQIKRNSKLPDPNNDGVTEFSEMLEQANKLKKRRGNIGLTNNSISFEFDTNKDKVVTQEEFLANHKEVFAMFDQNNDGSIDLTELKELREAQQITRYLTRR